MNELLSVYAIRNYDGKWFRANGQSGYGDTWVDDLVKAKLYPRISQARSRVTYFANANRELPVPQLVEFVVTEMRVMDEAARVDNARKQKDLREVQRQRADARWALENAQRDLARAQEKIDRLRGAT